MPTPPGGDQHRRGSRRLALAMVLIVVATWAVVDEPGPRGPVILALTRTHGIDAGDLPAIALYLVAGGLMGSWISMSRS